CHIPNCPTGITGTQGEYKGDPEHTKAYVLAVAEEVRKVLAGMGARHIREIVGKTEFLKKNPALQGRMKLVDLSRFLHPDMALARLGEGALKQFGKVAGAGVCGEEAMARSLNQRILDAARDAIETCQNADLFFRVKNSDR